MALGKLIQLPKYSDIRGNLSFIQEDSHVPFKVKRSFWIYDVPGGEERGGHAYHETEEFIVSLSGSFDVVLDDGAISRLILWHWCWLPLFTMLMIIFVIMMFSKLRRDD